MSIASIINRVVDPHHFIADPDLDSDPAFSFLADPDPDPAPHQSDGNLRTMVYRPSRGIHFEHP